MNRKRRPPRFKSRAGLFISGLCLLCMAQQKYAAADPIAAKATKSEDPTADSDPKTSRSETAQYAPRYGYRLPGRSIQGPLRVESTPAELLVSASVFPSGGQPKFLELPAHLGGGFLFYQPASAEGHSATNIYRAEQFTAELKPISRLPYAVLELRAGFDRVFAIGTGLRTALDPSSGELLPLEPLPPVVVIEEVAFSGTRLAAFRAPLVGVMATSDAGLSWHPLAQAQSIESSPTDTEVLLKTSQGIFQLSPELELVEPQRPGRDAAGARLEAEGFSNADEFGKMLAYTLAHGAQLGKEAVAVGYGRLWRASLAGGFSLHSSPAPLSRQAECLSVPDTRNGALFFCRTDQVELLAYENQALVPIKKLKAGRLLSIGQGAYLTSGACRKGGPTEASKSATSSGSNYCWLSRRGATTLHAPPSEEWKGIPKRRVSYAASKSGAFRIGWDQKKKRFLVQSLIKGEKGDSGTRSSAKAQASVRYFPLERGETLLELLATGSLLVQASSDSEGFSTWVVQGERFIGVRLLLDGSLDYGALQRPLARALFHGEKAFLWGAAGFAKQSLDGGLHFEELALPYRSADPELSQVLDAATPTYMGCGDAGCALGHLLRRGWNPAKLREAPPAQPRPLGPSGGARHHFSCGFGGMSSAPRRKEAASQFEGFWELAPPSIALDLEGRSVGFPHDLARLYAYGPRDQSWNRDGRFELRYIDPYDARYVKQSAASPHLVENLAVAENLLGTLDRASSSGAFLLDVAGKVGVAVLRTRSEQTLLGFREGEPLRPIPMISSQTGEELEVRNLLNVVESQGAVYAAFYLGRSELGVAEISESGFNVFARLPLGDVGARNLSLVGSTEGALGVAMDGDSGVVVYPLGRDGKLGSPIIAPPSSSRPPSCAPETTGFVVERELPLSPYLETMGGEAIQASGLRAKMIVGHQKACLEAMTARVRSLPAKETWGRVGSGTPLTLLNSDSTGNRSLFLCE